MSDFLTSPNRAAYLSGQSQGSDFLAVKPKGSSFGDYFGDTLGHSLAEVGIGASGIRSPKQDPLSQVRASELRAQDQARSDIADLAGSVSGEDNIDDNYMKAVVLGTRAGLKQDEIDAPFTAKAGGLHLSGDTVARLGTHGGYSDNTYFSPMDARNARTQAQSKSIADHAYEMFKANQANQQTTTRETSLEDLRAGHETDRENLRFQHEQQLQGAKPKKPSVGVAGYADLQKAVNSAIAGKVGELPTKEGDLPSDITQDPGVTDAVMQRAAEIMGDGTDVVSAVQKAMAEKADVSAAPAGANNTGGIDLSAIGLSPHTMGSKQATVKKKAADPLGLR